VRGGRFVEAAAKFGLELLAAEVGVCHDEEIEVGKLWVYELFRVE
jgi:hypothetical protein